MNKRFVNAVIISIAIHFAIITPLYGFVIFKEAVDAKKEMVVDYVVIKEIPKVDLKKPATPRMAPRTEKIELSKDVAVKEMSRTPVAKKLVAQKIEPARSRIARRTEARIRATKDYIGYYQFIRGRIRDRLKDNYRTYYSQGDVRVIFTLSSDGSLVSVSVDEAVSTGNQTLLDVAARSVGEAAPFAAFPKAISLPRMTFDLVINFRKR